MVGKCRDLLHIVSLHVNIEDQWLWDLSSADGYSDRGAYRFLTKSLVRFHFITPRCRISFGIKMLH